MPWRKSGAEERCLLPGIQETQRSNQKNTKLRPAHNVSLPHLSPLYFHHLPRDFISITTKGLNYWIGQSLCDQILSEHTLTDTQGMLYLPSRCLSIQSRATIRIKISIMNTKRKSDCLSRHVSSKANRHFLIIFSRMFLFQMFPNEDTIFWFTFKSVVFF